MGTQGKFCWEHGNMDPYGRRPSVTWTLEHANILEYLDSIVTAQIKVELVRMRDTAIHSGTGGDILRSAWFILFVFTEQSCMMPLLNHNKSDSWAILFFKQHASLLHCTHLMNKYLVKLALADSIPVEYDLGGLKLPIGFVEINKKLLHHCSQVVDNFLSTSSTFMVLCSNPCMVLSGIGIHTSYNCSDGRNTIFSRGGMCDIRTEYDYRFFENRWLFPRINHMIDSTQFGIYLQRDVGTDLRFCLLYKFWLHTLGLNSKDIVSNSFDFRVKFFVFCWQNNHDKL